VAGLRHGVGKVVFASKDRYEGEWARGQRHGLGTMDYAIGGYYEGEWNTNRRNGFGLHFTSKCVPAHEEGGSDGR
jgi:hypothetical protein